MFATDKQINFINSLTGKIGETLATRVIFDTLPNFRGFALLPKRDASKVIDALIDARDNGYDDGEDEGYEYTDAEFDAMFATLDC